MTLSVKCDCGKTAFTVDETKLQVAAFCHCKECRVVSSAPMVEVIGVTPDAIIMEEGKDADLQQFEMPDCKMVRNFCGACGNTMWNTNKFDLCILSQGNIRKSGNDMEPLKPTIHLWYSERITEGSTDSLPKFLNFPESFGGDGKLHEEPQKQGSDSCISCVIS